MTVTVTKQHKKNGKRGDPRADAIALALKDAGFIEPWVGHATCADPATWKVYRLPHEAIEFIYAYDHAGKGKPSVLTSLKRLSKVQRAIAARQAE